MNKIEVIARYDRDGTIEFNQGSWSEAFKNGYFYIQVPDNLKIDELNKFTKSFYNNTELTSSDVYFNRSGFQTEHMLMPHKDWGQYLNTCEVQCLKDISEILVGILMGSLKALNVSKSIWNIVTGGASEECPLFWFAANHYRSTLNLSGCPAHKDTGFVTLLYTEESGLEYQSSEKSWDTIQPIQGCFIVHFGESFEYLTKNYSEKVNAIFHRVRRIDYKENNRDRHSFAVFINSYSDKYLYQISGSNEFVKTISVKEFLEGFNKKTWEDYHDEFGIQST